ncbi:MAG: T9SS type A sorting domain-containing protein [Bacteroidales bacterium]|nr:T9SS type A sorting domain-containing protein [Bacteroidales bacterium]
MRTWIKYFWLSTGLFFGSAVTGQHFQMEISPADSAYYLAIPEYNPPELIKPIKSEYKIDNSEQPYFPPIVNQIGWECHILNGIYYNLSYELNRIRNATGDQPENQLPSHFTLNFLNEGLYEKEANLILGWEVAKNFGTPSIEDYGGIHYGGHTRWMTGYEKYYRAMKNRVDRYYYINTADIEGLEKLKRWLSDHGGTSEAGSLANCLVGSTSFASDTLVPGTEEEGHLIVTAWGIYPGHSATIVGYNDSIRFDLNKDGKYTNNEDINGDGKVDLSDFEIGALKVANSFGTEWGDDGFIYIMYRLLSTTTGNGGIWANRVYILDAREHDPLLTLKLTLKHDSRNKIKISAGIAADTASMTPEFVHEFYIFNYQGGDFYMQGGTQEEDKTLETGLDLTPLLSYVNTGQAARFFLLVNEKDPDGVGTGEIVRFSLMDYSDGVDEFNYPDKNIPLHENGLTQLSMIHTINFDEVVITTENTEDAIPGQSYTLQLQAENGTPPYRWNISYQWDQETTNETFPMINEEKLQVNYGFANRDLEFDFPFFKRAFNQVYLSVDGYILFFLENPYNFNNLGDYSILLRNQQVIMPFFADADVPGETDYGIWCEGNEQEVIFRWKTIGKNRDGTELNFATRLTSTGEINFYYGEMKFADSIRWCSGLSNGDEFNVLYSGISNLSDLDENLKLSYVPQKFPADMSMEENGIFSGTLPDDTASYHINFRVTDSRKISKTKQLTLHVLQPDTLKPDTANHQALHQNYPNPASDYTWIDFNILEECHVLLEIYNLQGKKVATLVNTVLPPDVYSIKVDLLTFRDGELPGGLYFYTIKMNEERVTRKMIIIR